MALLQGHGPSIPLWGTRDGLALAWPLTDSSFPACNPNNPLGPGLLACCPWPASFRKASSSVWWRDKLSSLSR